LGNLDAQTTDAARGTALNDLIGKWFLGTDEPATPAWASYSVTAGSLWGSAGSPSSADMRQGGLGDCYFIAAMGALADSNPAAIENMFINNGDGTYTVRFFYQQPGKGYQADYVTVNTLLPGYYGCTIFAVPGLDGSWWLPLLEKAYAQWNETGHEGRDGTNTYASLSGGWMDYVDEQALGYTVSDYWPAGAGAEEAVIAAIQSGEAVTAGIFSDGNSEFNALNLVSQHAYMVASYNASNGTFQLVNPWGCYEPQALTWAELEEFCPEITVANTSSTAAANSQPSGMSRGEIHAAALE
jgi:hypothetical protein